MKALELREKSIEELKTHLAELLRAQFSWRFRISSQQSNQTDQLRKIRKDIARVMTVMSQRNKGLGE